MTQRTEARVFFMSAIGVCFLVLISCAHIDNSSKMSPTVTKAVYLPQETIHPDSRCQSSRATASFSTPSEPDLLEFELLNNLNNGSSIDAIITELQRLGTSAIYKWIDFNGDRLNELVLALEYEHQNVTHESTVWVFQCNNGVYTSVSKGTVGFLGGFYEYNPRFLYMGDVNGDQLPDLVTQLTFGGSGCQENFAVISWSKGQIRNLLPSDSKAFPCETRLEVRQIVASEPPEIVLSGVVQRSADFSDSLTSYGPFVLSYRFVSQDDLKLVAAQISPTNTAIATFPVGTRLCIYSDLVGKLSTPQIDSMGNLNFQITLTNKSRSACALSWIPMLFIIDENGKYLNMAYSKSFIDHPQTDDYSGDEIGIGPDEQIMTNILWSNWFQYSSVPGIRLRISISDEEKVIELPIHLPSCPSCSPQEEEESVIQFNYYEHIP